MRPVFLAALATLPALYACTPTCNSDSLASGLEALAEPTPARTAALVAGACKTDEALDAWLANPTGAPSADAWQAACPEAPDPASLDAAPLLANRAAVFASCDAASLGFDETTFVTASGGQALAIAATRRLLSDERVDDDTARKVGRALLGAPSLELPAVAVPRVAVATAEPPPAAGIVVTNTEVRVGDQSLAASALLAAPPAGPSGHAVAELVAAASTARGVSTLAVAADAPAALVRRVAASVGAGGSVDLVTIATIDGRDDRPHRLTLAIAAEPPEVAIRRGPGGWVVAVEGLPVPPVEGCASPGATVCDAVDDAPAKAAVTAAELAGEGKPVGLDLPSEALADELVAWVARLGAAGARPALDTRFAPCVDPPDGMVCIPGGDVLVGDGRDAPGDGPGLVTLSTHYLDASERSVGDYRACVEAGACADVPGLPRDDGLPVERIAFLQARELCAFQGKRLPTEWELEQAARPPGTPRQDFARAENPGDPVPTCEVANSARCGGKPKPVGSGPPNAWGLRDVLGNVSEFSATYPKKLSETCGAACAGLDPQGPCDGAPMCKNRLTRVVRGGSYQDGADRATPAWRTAVRKKTAFTGIGVRCASDGPVLETLPSAWVASPPPPPAAPAPLTEAQRAVMASIDEDAIDEIPECEDEMRGHSRTDCKDPTHYIYPNEDRANITFPWIRNRGGALLGVGSDQNYTYAGIARSELLFLLDYDAIVVHIHRVNQAFVKKAESPDAFVALWDPKNAAEADAVIEAEWAGDPMMATYVRTHHSLNRIMHGHYQRTRAPNPDDATAATWLRDPALYTWVRDLWLGGRVVSLKGDMLGPNAMQGVGRACTELGVPMRVYYTSNAPNAWGGEMTAGYKRNVLSFPMDGDSVVLQALGWVNEFGQTGHWHFNVQDGLDVQRRLSRDGYTWLWQVVRPYRNTDDVDLTLSGIEGRWEEAHTAGGP